MALVQWLKLHAWKSEIAGSFPALAFKFQRNKMFLPCSLAKNKNCGEPPWPRGSVLGQPWLKFRIMCLAGSVTLFISPSSGFTPGPVYLICAQRWPKTPFITFYFYQAYLDFYKNHLVWTYTCVQTICFPNRSYYILLFSFSHKVLMYSVMNSGSLWQLRIARHGALTHMSPCSEVHHCASSCF